MRSIIRTLLISASTTLAVVALAPVAHAGQPVTPAIVVSPISVEPGATFTITGVGWTCVEPALSIDTNPPTASTPLGSPLPESTQTGEWTLDFQAPGSPGTYTVTAFDGECQDTATDILNVVAPTTTTTTTTTTTVAPTTTTSTTTLAPTTTQQAAAPATTLPQTGQGESRTALMGALALSLGLLLVWLARRNQTT